MDAIGEALDKILTLVGQAVRALLRSLALFLSLWLALCCLPFTQPSDFWPPSGVTYISQSVAGFVLRWLITYLLPSGETLIANSPFDAFYTIMAVGAGLAFVLTMPYVVYQALGAIFRGRVRDPVTGATHEFDSYSGRAKNLRTGETYEIAGVKRSQREAVRVVLLMAVGFFLAGLVFGLWMLPTNNLWTYQIQFGVGISGTLTLAGFLGTTALLTVGIGLIFEIPTIAYLLSSLGLLTSPMMKRFARPAALLCVFAAFLISPGVGLGLLEFPMAGLFFGLYLLAYRIVVRQERNRASSSKVFGALGS